jgi:OOP family OmpA-OmpF porin
MKTSKLNSSVASSHKAFSFFSATRISASSFIPFSGKSARRALVVCSSLLVLWGGAQAQVGRQIEALGQAYSAAQPVANGITRLTFFRPVDDAGAKAVSVYINQDYHTSLIRGGFSQVCLQPGPVDIGLRRVEDASLARNPILLEEIRLQSGAQLYLRVSDQPGVSMPMQNVPASQADSELAQTRLQLHTVSRASSVVSCLAAPVPVTPVALPSPVVVAPLPAPPLPTPAPPQVISLTSDALFAFGKSGLGDILLAGRTALDDVVRRVNTEYASVDSITILGHSDLIGRPEDKQKISEQRAQTVRDYLLSNGLSTTRILSQGRADREPVASSCGVTSTPLNILCNRPNRRVSIEISGIRR